MYKWFKTGSSKSPLNAVSNAVVVMKNASVSVVSLINEHDSQFYAIAESEINSGKLNQGLWSQALVKADGNENKRKSEYIKLRVMELKRSK